MCVLGAIMLEPREVWRVASELLQPHDFYLDGHRTIFQLMGELHDRGIPPDAASVIDELRARSLLDNVGGSGVVLGMLNSVPTAANVEAHAQKILEKSRLRALVRCCTVAARGACAQEQSYDRLADELRRGLVAVDARDTDADIVPVGEPAREYWDALARRAADPGAASSVLGYPTGIPTLDRLTGGLRPGKLMLVAGGTGRGKSALAAQISRHLAVGLRLPVLFCSLEMTPEENVLRLLCIGTREGHLGISSDRLTAPSLGEREWRVLNRSYQQLLEAPLYVHRAMGGLTLARIATLLRRAVQLHGVKIGVVDYLQRVQKRDPKLSPYEHVSEVADGLKDIAMELGIALLVPVQLNRDSARENRRPELPDMRESGVIEQAANDVVMIWHEPGQENKWPKRAELIVRKARAGAEGTVDCWWYPALTQFSERAPEDEENGGKRQ
jgi:replicative DNA helicase